MIAEGLDKFGTNKTWRVLILVSTYFGVGNASCLFCNIENNVRMYVYIYESTSYDLQTIYIVWKFNFNEFDVRLAVLG